MNLDAAVWSLAELTGGLQPTGDSNESQLGAVRVLVARCLLLDQPEPLFDPSEPFLLSEPDKLDPLELAQIREICTRVSADIQSHPGPLGLSVFRRKVPTTADLSEAAPEWADGAAADPNFGPFIDTSGRPFWFSVYNRAGSVSLSRGAGGPAILFFQLPTPPGPASNYTLAAGSVWIAANAMDPSAPSDRYCGLRIASGSLKLSVAGTIAGGGIVVPAAATLLLNLRLDSPEHPTVPDANPLHPAALRRSIRPKQK